MCKRIFLIIWLSLPLYGLAQSASDVKTPSSNVSSLCVFNQYPVSLSTGVPNISIPIYDVTYNSLNCGIQLSYNTNLVKPDIHPGWVGLGWDLSTGGAITRVVNDLEDDDGRGFYTKHGLFARNDWATYARVHDAATAQMASEYIYQVHDDVAPDEFNFSCLGISGSFFLDENGNWKIRCNDGKLQVRVENMNYQTFGKFTITDSKGIRYIFGGDSNLNSIEYSTALFGGFLASTVANTWHLTQVVFPNGNGIFFNYERGEPTISPQIYQYNRLFGNNNKLLLAGSVITTSYLKSIQTDKEIVTFSRSPTTELRYNESAFLNSWSSNNFNYPPSGWSNVYIWNKLDKIEIAEKTTSQVIKTFKFTYTSDPTKRLKLQKISEYGTNDLMTSKDYNISYNDDLSLPSAYFANQTDLWGFYNHTDADYSSSTSFFTSRSVNAQYLQAEVINHITYPTLGYTKFTFEPNTYSKETANSIVDPLVTYSTDQIGSGLRIKKIENFDTNDQVLNSLKYFYQTAYSSGNALGVSTGVLNVKPRIDYQNEFVMLYVSSPGSEANNGANILYSNVTEVSSDGGYMRNTLSNLDNGINNEYMDLLPAYYPGSSSGGVGFTSKYFERGKLLSKSAFDNNDHLLSQQSFSYVRLNQDTDYVRGYILKYSWGPNVGITEDFSKAVKTLTYPYMLSQEISTTYQTPTSSPITSTVQYTYDPATLNLTSKTKTGTMGKSWTTKYRYVGNVLEGATIPAVVDTWFHPFAFMYTHGMTGVPIETIQLANDGTGEKIIGSELTKYQGNSNFLGTYPSLTRIDNVAPLTTLTLDLVSPKSSYTNYSVYIDDFGEHDATIDPQLHPVTNYQGWDIYNNLTQVAKEGSNPTSYEWGYNNSYLVAECKNAIKSDIAYSSFERMGEKGGWDYLDGYADNQVLVMLGLLPLSNAATGKQVYMLETGQISKSGLDLSKHYTISFWYTSSTLPTVSGATLKINNTLSSTTMKFAQFEAFGVTSVTISGTGYIDELRLCPSDAQMTTYTYDPLVGMTSSTNSKDQTTYYQYDSFQRLKTIRDIQGNILKSYCYNYAGQTTGCGIPAASPSGYTNQPRVGSFTKNDCGSGYVGSTVSYNVARGTYSSAVSVDVANQLADADIAANGQAYANNNGTCTFIPIYARVEISNQSTTLFHGNPKTRGDVYIKLYSDLACTTPYALTGSLSVNVAEGTTVVIDYGSPDSSTNNTFYSISAGSSSYYMGNKTLDMVTVFLSDGVGSITYDTTYSFDVASGTGYIVSPTLIN